MNKISLISNLLRNINHKKMVGRNLILLILISFISGCGFWTNFKTYFNTYYNANRIFTETEKELSKDDRKLFVFEEKPARKNITKKFDEVIERTSAILQYHKESDYVEDALLMTGKSFYYQQNYSRALRKFNELATIADSEFKLENKLWIGKTYLKTREFTKALKILDEVKEEAATLEENDVLIEVFVNKISYLIYNEKYDIAISEIYEMLRLDFEDELKAEVLYELGLLYKKVEDYESAESTFAKVNEYSPTFEIEFKSQFEAAKLTKELGNEDKGLVLLQDLRDQDAFSDNWGDIDLEIGKIFYERQEIEPALDKFTEVDTTYKKTKASGIARFYRAEVLENYYRDYDSALVFYKSISNSLAPQELKSIAKTKSILLNKYIGYHRKLANLHKKFLYLTDESVFVSDSIDYVEKVKEDSIKNAIVTNNKDVNKRRGNSRRNIRSKYKAPKRPKISVDSVQALNSKNYFELANLLFSEFDNPDSAFYYYKQSLREKENNPNKAQTYYAMGNYFAIKKDKAKADSMFYLVYNEFEFDPIRNEAAKQLGLPIYDFNKDPVEDEYVIAEAIYDSLKYDSAITKFFKIYKENPKSIFASKSLYTIGFILENDLEKPDSAASIYDTLATKYRTSIYAKAIRPKLTAYKQKQKELQAIQDSIKQSEQARLDSLNNLNNILPEETQLDSLKNTNNGKSEETMIDTLNSLPKRDIIEPKVKKDKNNKIPK